jgi:hypothetical protein
VDYSIFIMVAILVILERLEKQPGATLAAFPLPIFLDTAFGFVVLCFSAASSSKFLGRGGSLYRNFLGQDGQSGMKMDGIGA